MTATIPGTATPGTREERADVALALALAMFALFLRLATLMPIHTGVDERDYWSSAKAIALGLPYPELTHRTVRFSVILPTAAAVALLGEHPIVYYVTPVLNAMAQAALAYLIGRRLAGRLSGFLASLFLVLFPYMIRAGSQVRPEVFSLTYILLSLSCLLSYLKREEAGAGWLLAAAALLFVAYESKVTNLFFAPGMAIAIWSGKKRLKPALAFCGALAALFAMETGAYALFSPYRLGQLQVIAAKHLSGNEALKAMGFLDLFKRYMHPYLQAYWQLAFLAGAAAAAYLLAKRRDSRIVALVLVSASFFFCITFAVTGLDPVVPAEPFINRYFTAALGPLALILGAALADGARRVRERLHLAAGAPRPAAYVACLGALALLVSLVFSTGLLPSGAAAYANSLGRLGEHPLALTAVYRRLVDEAYSAGRPIVSVGGVGGTNALASCRQYYLSASHYVDGLPPAGEGFAIDDREFQALGPLSGLGDGGAVYAAVRNPFRIRKVDPASLASLQDDAFPGESPGGKEEEK